MRNVMLLIGTAAAMGLAVVTAPRPQAPSFGAPAGTVPAPDPNVPLYFEAASIKPSNPPGQGIRRQPGGRFNTINAPPIRQLSAVALRQRHFRSHRPRRRRSHAAGRVRRSYSSRG